MNSPATQSIGGVLRWATAFLRAHEVESPRLDAELLLGHLLGVGRAYLVAHSSDALAESQVADFTALLQRRTTGEPVAYLRGYRDWYDLTLRVSPAVLVPRPETEGLLERAIRWAQSRSALRSAADIGTGSGALALALGRQLPGVQIYATDLSAQALEIARENAATYGLTAWIQFKEGDLLAPLSEPVDLIVTNLPYIGEQEYTGLMRDVRCFEPRIALVGGVVGHELLARLLHDAPPLLRPGGAILAELGPDQAKPVLEAAQAHFPAARIALEDDDAGLARYLTLYTA